MTSKLRPVPSQRSSAGTPDPVCTFWSCQTLEKPRTMRPMPRVMIRGWTRKIPLPMPLIRPASAAAPSATAMPRTQPPGWWTNVAVTKPAMDAT
jgi:hypothetical protein